MYLLYELSMVYYFLRVALGDGIGSIIFKQWYSNKNKEFNIIHVFVYQTLHTFFLSFTDSVFSFLQRNTHTGYYVWALAIVIRVWQVVGPHIPFDPYHWCVNINIINCEKNWPTVLNLTPKKWYRSLLCGWSLTDCVC